MHASIKSNVYLVKNEISDLQNKDFKFKYNEPEQKNPWTYYFIFI